uniref:PRO2116 n=1 Tax=Homo sapiens TaxID=9606 RepID=Q9P1E9_HUMAN|nr:PRO2116 [Homo sapiens]
MSRINKYLFSNSDSNFSHFSVSNVSTYCVPGNKDTN